MSTFSKEVSSLRSPDSQTARLFAHGSFAALDITNMSGISGIRLARPILAYSLMSSWVIHSSIASSEPRLVTSPEAACSIVQAYFIQSGAVPASGPAENGWSGWFCEDLPFEDTAFYLVGLHSNRVCDGICSNNMGYYFVEKTTGSLYELNPTEWTSRQAIACVVFDSRAEVGVHQSNKPLVPTRNGEAPLLAAQRRRWA